MIHRPTLWASTPTRSTVRRLVPQAIGQLQVRSASTVDAGTNSTLTLCSTSGVVDLFASLGGTPDPDGTWTAPGGAAFQHVHTRNGCGRRLYVYGPCSPQPCSDASATVTVTVNAPPNAGSNASITVCSTSAAVDLFDALNGTPDAGGAWTGPGGTPVSSSFVPGTSAQGVYTYAVLGTPPCANVSATVNVTVVNASNAGANAATSVCSNGTSFALISRLGGTPQAGGTWVGPGGAHGPTFDPATDAAGAYIYTVAGTAPCPAVSATLTVTKQQAPNAGTNGTATVCSTDASFALLGRLGDHPPAEGRGPHREALCFREHSYQGPARLGSTHTPFRAWLHAPTLQPRLPSR